MATLSSKALPTGLATLAQGTLADSALQPTGDGSSLTGISPFKPVAVTGATPSLNVGTYNYFSQGAVTADTTVTFASVPTEASWSYNFVPSLLNAWNISTASYSQTFSVTAQDTNPFDIFFKPDGTKMYVLGLAGVDVNEYDLSTAWDVSTAVFLQLVSVSANTPGLRGLFFKPDGLKMYIVGSTDDAVDEYDLSTAWDVSTVTYLQTFSVATEEVTPYGLFFKPDGLKMYVAGATGIDVNEYDLSTAWNVTTAVFLQLFSVSAQVTSPYSVFFKPDGTKMYIMGATGVDVNEYDLSTAWNVSTASFLQLFSVATQDAAPRGLFFKPDGDKMYVSGGSGDSVYEYDLGTTPAMTLPAAVQNPPTEAIIAGDYVTYEFATLDGGTTVTLINEEVI